MLSLQTEIDLGRALCAKLMEKLVDSNKDMASASLVTNLLGTINVLVETEQRLQRTLAP
jgi:hypothetical protein